MIHLLILQPYRSETWVQSTLLKTRESAQQTRLRDELKNWSDLCPRRHSESSHLHSVWLRGLAHPLPAWSLGLLPPSQCPLCLDFCFCSVEVGSYCYRVATLATWLGTSTHLTRASLTDALFAFKVSIETMLIMLSSALAPLKHIFFFCESHKVWSFWLCPLHVSLLSLCL